MNFEEISEEWLVEELTMRECEIEHAVTISIGDSQSAVPFGFLNDKWIHLKSCMLATDEIWNFSSPQDR